MLRQSYLPIFDLINLNLYLTLKQNKMKKIMKHKFQYMLLLLLAIPCHSFAGEKSHVADSENLLLNKSLQQSVTIKGTGRTGHTTGDGAQQIQQTDFKDQPANHNGTQHRHDSNGRPHSEQ